MSLSSVFQPTDFRRDSSQATHIEDVLKEHSAILKEIQAWGSVGVERANTQLVPATAATSSAVSNLRQQPITFEVYAEQHDGSRRLICSRASLLDDWAAILESEDQDQDMPIFECLDHADDGPDHASKLAEYTCQPNSLTFVMMITNHSSQSPISLSLSAC
jgi:hypothetical protein